MKPDYAKIFGSNGVRTPIADLDYLLGLAYLGDNPPTREEFNWLFNLQDLKLKWLDDNKMRISAPAALASVDGVLTLPDAGNSFIVNGNEAITQITGWDGGLAVIRWNSVRTLTHSAGLVLQGSANRLTAGGDVGIYEVTAAATREVSYFPATAPASGINIWKANTAYNIGDIVFSSAATSYKRFECVVAGNSAANEPAWGSVGTLVDDGTAKWIVDDIRDGTPVGRAVPEILTAARAGYLKANGALVARASYPRLWVWANASGLVATEANWAAGQTGRFADGDGATTFRLPDLRAEFIRGLDDSRGVDAARVMGAAQVDDLKSHIHNIYLYSRAVAGSGGVPIISDQAVSPTEYSGTDRIKAAGGAETRPRNIAYLYCIKY